MSEAKTDRTNGRTVTRADLSEVVYHRVGLSRTELAELVQAVPRRDLRRRGARRDGQAVVVRLVRRALEKPAHRPQPEDRRRSADFAAPRDGVQAVQRAEGAHQRRIGGRERTAAQRPTEPRRGSRRMDKSPEAFRTISEVAEDMDLPQHVLRFWETRFPQIKPLKRGGGRRYYRPDDVELLRADQAAALRRRLYDQGRAEAAARAGRRIGRARAGGPRGRRGERRPPAAAVENAGRSSSRRRPTPARRRRGAARGSRPTCAKPSGCCRPARGG